MASRVRVFTSALYMTTSGVVFGADGALVIDPNLLPREIEAIRWYVEQSEKAATVLLYTHHHWDHVLGGQAFPSARRLAHRCFTHALETHPPLTGLRQLDDTYYVQRDPPFELQPPHELVDDGWTGDLGDQTFRLIHLPGHASDMLGVHLPAEKTLFAADMLADVELPMIEGDGGDYLASLHKVDALVVDGQVETLVPGHGHVARGAETIRARIAADVAYIEQLRHVIGDVLHRGAAEDAAVEAGQALDYRGKTGWPPMAQTHAENVQTVYQAMKRQMESS